MELTKNERIALRKKELGSRNDRNLKKYSDKFNNIFSFYFNIYRKGIVNFCGTDVKVKFDITSSDAKYAFREFENGRYPLHRIKSKHSNLLQAVLIGKKGWGLWVKEWSEGIGECSFRKEEILNEFKLKNITIPDSLLVEFDNAISKQQRIQYQKYLKNKNTCR